MKNLLALILLTTTLFAETITREEAQQFGEEIKKVILEKPNDFQNYVDVYAYLDRVFINDDVSAKAIRLLNRELQQKKIFTKLINNALSQMIKSPEAWQTLLGELDPQKSDHDKIFFNFVSDDLLAYFMVLSIEKIDGEVKIVDVLFLSSSHYSSVLVRPTFLYSAGQLDKNFLTRALSKDKNLLVDLKKITKASQYLRGEKYKEALEELQSLDDKSNKLLLAVNIKVYSYIGLENYQKAFQLIASHKEAFHPDCLNFALNEAYFGKEKYAKALKPLKALRKKYPRNAYLESMYALALSHVKADMKYFYHYIKKAKLKEPKSAFPYLLELVIYGGEKEHYKKVYKALKTLKKRYKKAYPKVKNAPEYAAFRKTKYYKAYLKL